MNKEELEETITSLESKLTGEIDILKGQLSHMMGYKGVLEVRLNK